MAAPVIEAADCTVEGSNTASTSWGVSHPAASAGDLLIFNIAWDDSTNVTSITAPAGPNGETLTSIAGPVASASTEVRGQSWYTVATGSWSASTITFTPAATESWTSTVIRVPAGEFDATTPIGASSTSASAGTAETSVASPAFSAGSTDGDGRLVWFAFVDQDPLSATNPTGWTIRQRQDLGAVAHGIATRDSAVTASESIASAGWAIAGDSWASVAYIVRAPVTHTSTGTLSSQSAVVSGASELTGELAQGGDPAPLPHLGLLLGEPAFVTHTSTGALVAQSATVAGSALSPHTSTGTLAAQSATVAGSASRMLAHASTGALTAQSAVVAGSSAHLTLHASTGVIAAQSADVAGTALHPHTSAGVLAAQSAVIVGASDHASVAQGGDPAPLPHLGLLLAPNTAHEATGALAAQAGAEAARVGNDRRQGSA